MKKACLILFACGAMMTATGFMYFKKYDLDFKVYLKPDKIYTQVTTTISHSQINYYGNDAFLEAIKEKGVANPTIKDTVEKRKIITKTGHLKGKKFPLTISMANTSAYFGSGSTVSIYGHCKLGKIAKLDSVAADNISPEAKEVLLETAKSTLTQVSTHEKKLNVGDTFSITQPLNLPIGSTPVQMDIKTTYKLESIVQDTAYFNTIEAYTFQINVQNTPLTAKGHGSGNITYNIKDNYYITYHTVDTLDMGFKYQQFSMKMQSHMNVTLHATVEDNK